MDHNKRPHTEKKIRVMEVFYIEDQKMYIDYFTKNEWNEIVEAFFIKGGLEIPEEIDVNKKANQLTEEDYTVFFKELGYEVSGFSYYDPLQHTQQTLPWPSADEIGGIES